MGTFATLISCFVTTVVNRLRNNQRHNKGTRSPSAAQTNQKECRHILHCVLGNKRYLPILVLINMYILILWVVTSLSFTLLNPEFLSISGGANINIHPDVDNKLTHAYYSGENTKIHLRHQVASSKSESLVDTFEVDVISRVPLPGRDVMLRFDINALAKFLSGSAMDTLGDENGHSLGEYWIEASDGSWVSTSWTLLSFCLFIFYKY